MEATGIAQKQIHFTVYNNGVLQYNVSRSVDFIILVPVLVH